MLRSAMRTGRIVGHAAACLGVLGGGCPPQGGDGETNANAAQSQETPIPVADAGTDIALDDFDENGFELVLLNGSKSRAGEGRPVEYEWSVGGRTLGKGASLQTPLGVGAYRVTLTVFDAADQLAQDQVDVVVSGKQPFFGIRGAGAREAYADAVAQFTDGGLFALSNTIEVSFNTPAPFTLGGLDIQAGPRRLEYTIVTPPSFGSLDGAAPNLTYTPEFNYIGVDALEFTIRDGRNESEPARVTFRVGDPPTVLDGPGSGPGNPGDLYSNDCSTNLFTVNIDTGAVRIVGGIGTFMWGLAFQSRDLLIGTDGSSLYEINPDTAVTTWKTHLTKNGELWPYAAGLEFDRLGNLWTFGNNEAATINVATGEVTVHASLGGNETAGDPALDTTGDILIATYEFTLLRFDPLSYSTVLSTANMSDRHSGLAYESSRARFAGLTWCTPEEGEYTAVVAPGQNSTRAALLDPAVSGVFALTERP